MKLKLTRVLLVLFAVALVYTSCKKSTVKPTVTTKPDVDAVAKQIALNLYKSLTGQLGGTNLNDGIKSPLSISPKHNNKTLNDVSGLCGFVIDTAWSSSTMQNDTDTWVSNKYNFVYTCSGDNVDGYTAYDSIKREDKNSKFINSYMNVQQYVVKAISPDFKLISTDGRISTVFSSSIFATGVYYTLNCDYTLNNLHVDLSGATGDVVSGTATFNSNTRAIDSNTGPGGLRMEYTGKIVFQGDHTAKLTIDPDHQYTINFLTSEITPL